ncbi:hypothetical protein [Micromonospora endophytica]|uniref:Ferritin-like domain-containing protein n=1 Tax=Micromonospora endophytica TaxID=515350 RepID=A0A2W2CXC0_9ACTN|nr:hypothetical protein [Micromonospora endophytica]PZF96238.1 hypothetical protein C1I93_14180 [Micromonospora endophytica]RIW50337.1 hypothetical protein D3H59_02585 [Micromonospora endophytica]
MLGAGALLALGGAAGPLTGCGLLDRDDTPKPDPLDPLRDEALRLAAGLRATAAAHPDLAGRLTPLAESHEAHAAELARVTGATSPSGTAAPPATAGTPPTDQAAALTALRQAERTGRDAASTACAAAPADRVALLGSIAAARASHLEALK